MAGTNVAQLEAILNLSTATFRNQLKAALAKASVDADAGGANAGWSFINGFKKLLKPDIFTGISDAFKAEAEQARLSLNTLIRTGNILGPTITAVAAAIGSLGTALVSLVSVVGAATPSLIVFGNALSALVQGGLVVQQAMRGVAEAIAIDDDVEGPSAAIEGALDRVREARIRLRNIINKEQPERLAAAREAAAEAEQRAADALRGSERALRNYNKAQERTLDAINNLNEARERARERIQQLRFETEGAAISERQARLSFERARDSLQAVQDLPPNSRARQEAELAFAEADLNLRRAIDRNSDLKKEEDAATRAGVEGSDEVVSAKKAIEDATQAEVDAQYEAARAYLAAAKARQAADKAAQDASAGGAVQQQIDADIAKAREQLKDALEDLEDARNSGGASQLQKALEGLSPAARDFVIYMRSIKKEFNVLRDAAATGFFPLLRTSIELVRGRLDDLAPMFESTGKSAGTASQSIAGAFTETQTFGNIQTIWENNNRLIEIFGRTIANLVRGISALLVAAGPLTERFARFIETVTGQWATRLNNDIEGQTERFNRAGEIASRLGGIIGNLGRIFGEIGEIVMGPGGAGESILTFFEQGTVGLLNFLNAGSPDGGNGSLVETFRIATENGLKLLEIIGDVIVILFNLGAGEGFTEFLTSLDGAVEQFGAMGEEIDKALPEFGEFIEQFAILTRNLTDSGAMRSFFIVLTESLRAVNGILENETVRNILTTLGYLKGITLAFGSLWAVGKWVFMAIFGNLMSITGVLVGGFATGLTNLGLYMMNFGGIVGTMGLRIGMWGEAITKFLKSPLKNLFKGIRTLITTLRTLAFAKMGVLGPWLLLGVAIVAIGLLLWKFRKQIANFVKGIIDWFKNLYNRLVGNSIIPDMVNGIIEWITGLWEKFTSLVKEGISKVVEFFKELPGKVLDAIVEFGTKVFDFIMEYHPVAILWRLIRDNWDTIKNWFSELPGRIKDAIVGLSTKVRDFIRDYHPILILFRFVQEKWPELKNWLTTRIDGIADWFRGLPQKIREKVRGLWDSLKDGFVNALNRMIRAWNDFKLQIRIPDNAGTRFFGIAGSGFTIETPNIPEIRLAKGGIVPAVSGGMLALLGEGGRSERVEPLDSKGLSKRDKAMIDYMGGRGVTINVYPSQGMNERELANMVSRRLAYELRAGGI